MRGLFAIACCVFLAWGQSPGPDAREIVRKSVELDQINWQRRADYTWVMKSRERHFDSQHRVSSEHEQAWETIVLDGQPFERAIERDDHPLKPAEQKKEQEKLDEATERLAKETGGEKQRRLDDLEKNRRRQREFLREIPDAFNVHLDGDGQIDGQDVWIISGVPKPGYHAHSREGAAMLKIRGRIWIAKAGYQWVRLEAETTGTISFGWFLARLNPGAKVVFEQTRINDEVWLPKRGYLSGSGRIGLVKRLTEDQEITWSNYRKFRVDSKIVPNGQ